MNETTERICIEAMRARHQMDLMEQRETVDRVSRELDALLDNAIMVGGVSNWKPIHRRMIATRARVLADEIERLERLEQLQGAEYACQG